MGLWLMLSDFLKMVYRNYKTCGGEWSVHISYENKTRNMSKWGRVCHGVLLCLVIGTVGTRFIFFLAWASPCESLCANSHILMAYKINEYRIYFFYSLGEKLSTWVPLLNFLEVQRIEGKTTFKIEEIRVKYS